MLRRLITKEMLAENPGEKWNQFVELIVIEDYNELTDIQKVAHLCFGYDSEVQNGGHLQYFVNRGINEANDTVLALNRLGAQSQNTVLSKAINIVLTKGIPRIESVQEYVDEALEGKFEDLDSEYYNCEPSILDLLENYLDKHEEEFLFYEKT